VLNFNVKGSSNDTSGSGFMLQAGHFSQPNVSPARIVDNQTWSYNIPIFLTVLIIYIFIILTPPFCIYVKKRQRSYSLRKVKPTVKKEMEAVFYVDFATVDESKDQ